MGKQDNENKIQVIDWGLVIRSFMWDFILLTVLIINLLLICWDWLFSIPSVMAFFEENMPGFYSFYYPVHLNIKAVDLFFVGVYVLDLLIGWGISLFKKKEKFYQYPLLHWYDVIGCIPAGSLVFLRFLRVVSIFVRLYKKKLVNLGKIRIFRKIIKIYNIILEEISDRVVLNILSGIKTNVKSGMPVAKEIIDKIVLPHKERIISLVLGKVREIAVREYSSHKKELATYISASSRRAVEGNKELARLKLIPVVGSQITDTISKSISQTVVSVVDNIVRDTLSDTGQSKLKVISDEVTDYAFMDLERELSPVVTDIVVESIALIARTAGVRQWKLDEIRERIAIAKSAATPDEELIERLENDYQALFLKEFQKNFGE